MISMWNEVAFEGIAREERPVTILCRGKGRVFKLNLMNVLLHGPCALHESVCLG